MNEPNGNGFTQKEMLVRIDSKLDALAGQITTVELKQAVHEARPSHSESLVHAMDERTALLEENVEVIKNRISYAAGAAGLILALSPVAYRYIFH